MFESYALSVRKLKYGVPCENRTHYSIVTGLHDKLDKMTVPKSSHLQSLTKFDTRPEVHSENRNHSQGFTGLACQLLHHTSDRIRLLLYF